MLKEFRDYPSAKEIIKILPHMKFKPKLFKKENIWCALYGNNMEDGIIGFGETPNKALKAFDKAFDKAVKPKKKGFRKGKDIEEDALIRDLIHIPKSSEYKGFRIFHYD